MAKTAAKSLVAYYLSGFSAYLLLSNRLVGKPYPLSFDEGLQLVTFAKVAWYSEFLLTFFLITLLVLVFFQGFKRLTNSPVAMLLISVACLLTAILLPSDLVVARPLSLLVGTKGHFIFPVIQYLPVFLAGLYFAKYKLVMNKVALILAAVGTSVFMTYYLIHRTFPAEFSPSIYWLVGSYGILYGYFLVAKWLERRTKPINWLLSIGSNTLFYLVVSNFILFTLSNHIQAKPVIALLIGISVLLAIRFLLSLIVQKQQPSPTTVLKPSPVNQPSAW